MCPLNSKSPASDLDLWSGEALLDPFPHYRQLRDAGPVVWLSKANAWGAFRYQAVRGVLGKPKVFSSANGVMLNDFMNKACADARIMLCSDDPRHRALRRVFMRPLTPQAVERLRSRLTGAMNGQVDKLVRIKSFDAVKDLAQFLPLTVVAELVGLSDEGRDRMLNWASAVFDSFGPEHGSRTQRSYKMVAEVFEYISNVPRDELNPDGWGMALFNAADRGEISVEDARSLLLDYLTPSLDTTINALSGAILLFGRNPEQWSLLRRDPALIPDAFDEVVRVAAPIRGFGRQLADDYEIEGVRLDKGDRIYVAFASANRDERHFPDPDRFLITRRPEDHLGFGFGPHICAGKSLARLEVSLALQALAGRVKTITIDNRLPGPHNTLNVIERLDVTVQ